MTDKCCKTCIYSCFPRDKLGRRMTANYGGTCRYKMPALPASVACTGRSTPPIKKYIEATTGKECEVYLRRYKSFDRTYAGRNEDFDFNWADGGWHD